MKQIQHKKIDLTAYGRPFLRRCSIEEFHSALRDYPHSLEMTSHNFWEMIYVNKGRERWMLADGTSLELSGGDVSIMKPGTLHQSEYGTIRPSTMLFMLLDPAPSSVHSPFSEKEIKAVFRLLGRHGTCVVHALPELNLAFQSLYKAAARSPEDKSEAPLPELWVRSLIVQAFLSVLRSLSAHVNRAYYSDIQHARKYIAENLTNDTLISRLVRDLGLTRSRFYSLFRKETGESPADYRRRLCCEKARQQLQEPSASVTQIAHGFGFSSSQHFISCFKKYFGVTPLAYREQFLSQRIRV